MRGMTDFDEGQLANFIGIERHYPITHVSHVGFSSEMLAASTFGMCR
jgi:hypothetical protein